MYSVVLYCTILLERTVLCCTILLQCTVLYYITIYCTLLYTNTLYYTILYYTILYYTTLYYTTLYYTIHIRLFYLNGHFVCIYTYNMGWSNRLIIYVVCLFMEGFRKIIRNLTQTVPALSKSRTGHLQITTQNCSQLTYLARFHPSFYMNVGIRMHLVIPYNVRHYYQ